VAVRRPQSGQAIVLVALMIVVIAGLAALAIDVGGAMSDRRDLQGSADMAALAAASSLGSGSSAANFVAIQYAARASGVPLPVPGCAAGACPAGTYASGDFRFTVADPAGAIDVTIQRRVTAWFGGVIGVPQYTVTASARASSISRFTSSPFAVMGFAGNVGVAGGGTVKDATFGGSVYSAGSFGDNNGPHEPTVDFYQTDVNGNVCPGPIPNQVDLGVSVNALSFLWSGPDGPTNFNVPPTRPFDGQAPVSTGPRFTTVTAATNPVTGHWMPGYYVGIFPSGGLLDPGVYVITNVAVPIDLGTIANAIPAPRGAADPTGAVSIVLDGSDTGAIDISNATLNGVDDLGGATAPPPRDPLGTHNFVIYATGYTAGFSLGPHSSSDVTGLLYAPDSFLNTNGNASPTFTGSAMFAGITTVGGGNGLPRYNWICGLGSVEGPNQPGSPAALQR
jgi:hypothetical protein